MRTRIPTVHDQYLTVERSGATFLLRTDRDTLVLNEDQAAALCDYLSGGTAP